MSANQIYVDKDDQYCIETNVFKTLEKLPYGHYSVTDTYNRLKLKKLEGREVSLFTTEDCTITKIISSISKFFDSEKHFKKLGICHKYAAMLYGGPGTGKTSALDYISQHFVINYNTYIIHLSCDGSCIDDVRNVLSRFSQERIIFMMEDIDTNVEGLDAYLCEMVDGLTTVQNKVFIGTTNYFDDLPKRLLRDGRFENHFEFRLPNEDYRRAYLTFMLSKIDRLDICEKLVQQTVDMTLAQITKLILQFTME